MLDWASFALTMPLVGAGVTERNPIIAALYGAGDVWAVAAYKLALTALVVFLLTRRLKALRRAIGTTVFVAAGIIGTAANTIALYSVLGA